MQESQVLERLKNRDKIINNLVEITDSEIQKITNEIKNDHQRLVYLSIQSEENFQPYLTKLDFQQKVINKYVQKRYKKLAKKSSPQIPVLKNVIAAFLIGGTICTLGQIVLNFFKLQGILEKEASAYTTMVMVFLGAFLTGLGIYDEIGRFGGAGSMVPITGFANSIVSPALEYKREGFVYGVGAKVFTIAGPVLLYGSLVSVLIGLIYYFI